MGRFVLYSDQGANVVRIFAVNHSTGCLQLEESLVVSPGSDPRHTVF